MTLTSDAKFVIGALLATIIVIGGGAYITSKKAQNAPQQIVSDALVGRLTRDNAPTVGPNDAKVTVVEFADFECPVCGAVYPITEALKEAYKDKPVRFVFRNFPLSQHKNAFTAAEAAMEAHRQGKFQEYQDRLFTNQSALTREDLTRYAQELGLNMDEFTQALDEHIWNDDIRKDMSDGAALNVQGTPTIFINNVRYSGNYTVEGFSQAIEQQLAL